MSAGLWTAFEAAAATGGMLCARGGDPDRWIAEEWAAGGVSIDTRTIQPGEMFVALVDQRDGHDFLIKAFERGASAALVARAPADAPDGAPLLVVGDTLEGLRDLARAARLRNFGKRIAVTGSAGKTSTKEMLRGALSGFGAVHASDRSLNNHWGVPLSLARLPMDADYGIFELGMNHAGEITPLTRLVAPHIAIVTTIAAAHLEFFGTLEAIAEAKAEIFLGMAPGGAAVLPVDSPQFSLLRKRAEQAGVNRIITFGAGADADLRLIDCRMEGAGSRIEAAIFGEPLTFDLGAPGRHQALNALAVIGAARALGLSAARVAARLGAFGAAPGRGAQTTFRLSGGRRITLLDESYNANPASMAAALSLLGELTPRSGGRRIAVLGEMLELGPEAPALHAGLAPALIAARIDKLYAAGALMSHLWSAAPATMQGARAAEAGALSPILIESLIDGDIVMVKGSNASRVSEIAAALRAEAGHFE